MNNTAPAAEKMILLLNELSLRPGTQAHLSRCLGISMSSTYRILMTLRSHDWIRKEESSGEYRLSDGILPLLDRHSPRETLLERFRSKVSALSEKYGIACKLSIRQGEKQVTLCRAEPPGPVRLTGAAGSEFPLIEGSVGAVLLSGETEENVRLHIRRCTAPIPEKEEPELVLSGIASLRKNGYALNARPNRWKIAALSVPVPGELGLPAAAFTLIGTEEDFKGKKAKQFAEILKGAIADEN